MRGFQVPGKASTLKRENATLHGDKKVGTYGSGLAVLQMGS